MSTPARSASAPSRSPACRSRRASWTLRARLWSGLSEAPPKMLSTSRSTSASRVGPGCGRERNARGRGGHRVLLVVVVGRVVGRMSWRSTSAPRTRPAAFSAKSSRSPVRGSGPISRTAATSRVRHPHAGGRRDGFRDVHASLLCVHLAGPHPHPGAEVVGRWTHSAHGRMQNRGTGEWLVPGTTRDSNVQGPGKKAQLCQGLFAVKQRWRLREWGELRPQRCARRKVLRMTWRGLAVVHP